MRSKRGIVVLLTLLLVLLNALAIAHASIVVSSVATAPNCPITSSTVPTHEFSGPTQQNGMLCFTITRKGPTGQTQPVTIDTIAITRPSARTFPITGVTTSGACQTLEVCIPIPREWRGQTGIQFDAEVRGTGTVVARTPQSTPTINPSSSVCDSGTTPQAAAEAMSRVLRTLSTSMAAGVMTPTEAKEFLDDLKADVLQNCHCKIADNTCPITGVRRFTFGGAGFETLYNNAVRFIQEYNGRFVGGPQSPVDAGGRQIPINAAGRTQAQVLSDLVKTLNVQSSTISTACCDQAILSTPQTIALLAPSLRSGIATPGSAYPLGSAPLGSENPFASLTLHQDRHLATAVSEPVAVSLLADRDGDGVADTIDIEADTTYGEQVTTVGLGKDSFDALFIKDNVRVDIGSFERFPFQSVDYELRVSYDEVLEGDITYALVGLRYNGPDGEEEQVIQTEVTPALADSGLRADYDLSFESFGLEAQIDYDFGQEITVDIESTMPEVTFLPTYDLTTQSHYVDNEQKLFSNLQYRYEFIEGQWTLTLYAGSWQLGSQINGQFYSQIPLGANCDGTVPCSDGAVCELGICRNTVTIGQQITSPTQWAEAYQGSSDGLVAISRDQALQNFADAFDTRLDESPTQLRVATRNLDENVVEFYESAGPVMKAVLTLTPFNKCYATWRLFYQSLWEAIFSQLTGNTDLYDNQTVES